MVPGNGFSQPGTWNRTDYDCAVPRVSNAAGWARLRNTLDKLVVSVHTYFDSDGGGNGIDIVRPHIIGQRLQPVVDWARARGLKVHLSEFGASSANPKAEAAVANALTYMDANSDVVIGWAWWAYGPPDWWGGYQFTLCPTDDYTVDRPEDGLARAPLRRAGHAGPHGTSHGSTSARVLAAADGVGLARPADRTD